MIFSSQMILQLQSAVTVVDLSLFSVSSKKIATLIIFLERVY